MPPCGVSGLLSAAALGIELGQANLQLAGIELRLFGEFPDPLNPLFRVGDAPLGI